MLGASLYIIVCTVRNRTRMRLRRLREPRYLIGAIVGVAYLYFSFFGRLRGARSNAERNAARARRDRTAPALSSIPGLVASGPAITGMALLFVRRSAGLRRWTAACSISRRRKRSSFFRPLCRAGSC